MQIVCPACAAHYEVPDDRLRLGRLVRCAQCGDSWSPLGPEAPGPEATGVARDESAEPRAQIASVTVPLSPSVAAGPAIDLPLAVRLAWVATALVLACLLWTGWHFRPSVMTAWPPSARVYRLLGAG